MKFYETLYIVHPALEAGRLKDIILDIQDTLKKHGGDIASTDVWGKKKLAYHIDNQKYGTYVLIQFKSDGLGNSHFNMNLEHNPNILRYLTTKIEESDIVTKLDGIDEQLNTGYTSDGGDKKSGDIVDNQAAPESTDESVSSDSDEQAVAESTDESVSSDSDEQASIDEGGK